MTRWKHFARLLLNKATPNRALTEIELELLHQDLPQSVRLQRVMVAGGARGGRGSEMVFLGKGLRVSTNLVTVNISQVVRPDVVADLTCSWPFRNGAFDAVVSTWVLEHLRNPRLFFDEAYRVLVPGGFLVVTVPFIHRKHGSPFDFWRFTDTALRHLALSAGFSHVEVRKVGGTPLLCVVALLWPFFRVPVLGASLALVASLVDYALLAVTRLLKKGTELVGSYPISYICYACRD